jgi:Crinkler effector protein N-terminal domain
MANIELICLMRGDTPAAERAFPVEIARSRLVGSLKKQIIQEKPNRFKNTDADELTLWGVSIPLDNNTDNMLGQLVFEDNEAKGIRKLLPTQRLSTHFPEKLASDHVHVIVELPIGE